MSEPLSLSKLNPLDIDEKIRLNENAGVSIEMLYESIKDELKDFQWIKIRAEVQIQCYTEQLEYIEKRLKEVENAIS